MLSPMLLCCTKKAETFYPRGMKSWWCVKIWMAIVRQRRWLKRGFWKWNYFWLQWPSLDVISLARSVTICHKLMTSFFLFLLPPPYTLVPGTLYPAQRAFQAPDKDPDEHLPTAMEPELRLPRDPTHGPPVTSPGGDRLGLWPIRCQRVSRRGLPRPRLDAHDGGGRRAGVAHAPDLWERFRHGKSLSWVRQPKPSQCQLDGETLWSPNWNELIMRVSYKRPAFMT